MNLYEDLIKIMDPKLSWRYLLYVHGRLNKDSEIVNWTLRLHEKVNKSLKRPPITYEEAKRSLTTCEEKKDEPIPRIESEESDKDE